MPNVIIVGGDYLIERMYKARGWTTYKDVLPDLVQFTGGEDVDPALYKEAKHATTGSNPTRDAFESHVFNTYLEEGVPMAGICRGGQFLNVMCGGRMWQHVDRHGVAETHSALDLTSGKDYQVTSTHHQMIRPTAEALLLLTANRSTFKETATEREKGGVNPDVESVFYPKQNVLCFQPHPEYVEADHECQTIYFDYLKQYLGLG